MHYLFTFCIETRITRAQIRNNPSLHTKYVFDGPSIVTIITLHDEKKINKNYFIQVCG